MQKLPSSKIFKSLLDYTDFCFVRRILLEMRNAERFGEPRLPSLIWDSVFAPHRPAQSLSPRPRSLIPGQSGVTRRTEHSDWSDKRRQS